MDTLQLINRNLRSQVAPRVGGGGGWGHIFILTFPHAGAALSFLFIHLPSRVIILILTLSFRLKSWSSPNTSGILLIVPWFCFFLYCRHQRGIL